MAEEERANLKMNSGSRNLGEDLPGPIHITTMEQIDVKLNLVAACPKFYGKLNENPFAFLEGFNQVCDLHRQGHLDAFKLKAFHFTLQDGAREWFSGLRPRSITTWAQMRQTFLDKYFPQSKTNVLKKEISGITQELDESFGAYWERFGKLVDSCPNHGFSEVDLLQIFYQGMTDESKTMVNVGLKDNQIIIPLFLFLAKSAQSLAIPLENSLPPHFHVSCQISLFSCITANKSVSPAQLRDFSDRNN